MFSRKRPVTPYVERVIDIVATPTDVFLALTSSGSHALWLGGGSVVDLVFGGEWMTVQESGRILDVETARRLVISRRPPKSTAEGFYYEDDSLPSIAVFTLEPRSETETELTLMVIGIPNRSAQKECERIWGDALERLRQHLELGRIWGNLSTSKS